MDQREARLCDAVGLQSLQLGLLSEVQEWHGRNEIARELQHAEEEGGGESM